MDLRSFVCTRGSQVTLLAGLTLALVPTALLAEEAMRTWGDATGKFKIQAKFLSSADGKVTLEREGGGQVEIELKRLSPADQKYVAELEAAADNPFKDVEESPFKPKAAASGTRRPGSAKSVPAPAREARLIIPDWSEAETVAIAPEDNEWKFDVPESAAPPKLSSKIISLPAKTDFFEGAKALVMNKASRRAVVGYSLNDHKSGGHTRLVLCDLEKGRLLGAGVTSGQFIPLALHNDGLQVLVRRDDPGGGNQDRLELWKLGRDGVDKILQWIPYDDQKGGEREIKWASFIGDDRVATVSGGGKLAVFDAKTAQPIYWLQIAGGCLPGLSPDNKYIAFSTGKEIGVLDAAAGEVVALQSAPQMHWPILAFSPSGQRLACCAFDKVYVWEFANGEMYREMPLTGMHVMGKIAWPSEDHLLLGDHFLVDLENQVRLWQYDGHDLVQTLGGLCWFVVSQGANQGGALVPSKVPHANVEDTLRKAMADPTFFVLKPGVTVSINTNGIADPAQREVVMGALARKLEANGFRVGSNGTIELVASTEVGGEREVAYHSFGSFGSRTYKIREHISRLKFMYGGQPAWQTESVNIPGILHLKEGQRVEDVLREHERPNFAFFERVELPKLLTKPSGGVTLGKSQVTVSGVR